MTTNQKEATRARPAAERARLKDGVHIEFSPRRVRAYFDNQLIADSQRVLLVFETKRPPVYWYPIADVRMDLLASKARPANAPSGTVHCRSRAKSETVATVPCACDA